MPHVVVCGVISSTRGKVYHHFGVRSFTAQDMQDMLRQVRATSGPDAQLAILWDNCRIHQAIIVREFAARPDIDIELVWNCPY